jgi:hypothetical protein
MGAYTNKPDKHFLIFFSNWIQMSEIFLKSNVTYNKSHRKWRHVVEINIIWTPRNYKFHIAIPILTICKFALYKKLFPYSYIVHHVFLLKTSLCILDNKCHFKCKQFGKKLTIQTRYMDCSTVYDILPPDQNLPHYVLLVQQSPDTSIWTIK